jgi:hypothetical protein
LPRTGRVDIGAFQSQGFTLTPVAGSTPQSASVGTPFAEPLAVRVTAINPVEPVNGGIVSFAAPASGASAALSAATATIQRGQASVTATANATIGGYIESASAARVSSVGFELTNRAALDPPPPALADVERQFDDLASVRAAIACADSHPGQDTIIFGPANFGSKPKTIRLIGGPRLLTDPATTTIIGPGAKRLTISGGRKSRVF